MDSGTELPGFIVLSAPRAGSHSGASARTDCEHLE